MRSTQKLPTSVVWTAGEAAGQRHGDGDADRSRHEVLHGQPGHLHQVTHHRLGDIVLPVGVRDERGGRVESQRRLHAGQAVGPRQCRLGALQPEDEQDRHRENASTARAYAGQLCWVSPSTPSSRYTARSTR